MSVHNMVKLELYTGETIEIKDNHHDFARAYVFESTTTKAYERVYGSDVKGAIQSASILLKRDDVQQAIDHYKHKKSKSLDISEAALLVELAACGFYKISDLLKGDGQVKPPKDWDTHTHHAMSSYKVKTVGSDEEKGEVTETSFTMVNKLQALKTIAEIKGYGDINDSGNVNVTINRTMGDD